MDHDSSEENQAAVRRKAPQGGLREGNPSPAGQKRKLRREMRRARRGLSESERREHAWSLKNRLAPLLRTGKRRVSAYLALDGEMDLGPTIEFAWSLGVEIYLPVLHGPKLWFLPYEPHTPLLRGKLGLLEPHLPARRRCPPFALDLVLVPLVGFDMQGNRLGMGGGFYDRTFAFLSRRAHWRSPTLLGVAHELQRLEDLRAESWDIPMAGVVTESGWYKFGSKRRVSPR